MVQTGKQRKARTMLRRFKRGERQLLAAKLRDLKLPQWAARRYRIVNHVRQGMSVLAASRVESCAKETAYRCVAQFNAHGFANFERPSNPNGKPSKFTKAQLEALVKLAQCQPTDMGLPFTTWSIANLYDYAQKHDMLPDIGPERLRQVLRQQHVSWQRTKTWKVSNDPKFAQKKRGF